MFDAVMTKCGLRETMPVFVLDMSEELNIEDAESNCFCLYDK